MSFRKDLSTAEQAMRMVTPLLESWKVPGTTLLDTNDAHQAELWQRTLGDVLMTTRWDGKHKGVEVKGEKTYTGNLFIETWSNREFGRQRIGWAFTTQCDSLVMVYLDVRAAFVMRMQKLYTWCFEDGNLYRLMPEKERVVHQSKEGRQRNVTCGVPVPYSAVFPAINGVCYRLVDDAWRHSDLADVVPMSHPMLKIV